MGARSRIIRSVRKQPIDRVNGSCVSFLAPIPREPSQVRANVQRVGERKIPGVAYWVGANYTRHRGKLYAAMNLVLTVNGGANEIGL